MKKTILVCALFVVGCLRVDQKPNDQVESESTSTQGICVMDDDGVWQCGDQPGGGTGGGGGGYPYPNPRCMASCTVNRDCYMIGYDDCKICSENGHCVDGTAVTGAGPGL